MKLEMHKKRMWEAINKYHQTMRLSYQGPYGTKTVDDAIEELICKVIERVTPEKEEKAELKPCSGGHSHKDRYADGWNECIAYIERAREDILQK